jgi:hypothetical protein
MGTGFFHKGGSLAGPAPTADRVSEPNMMSRAIGAPNYAARGDAALAGKDLGAAAAFGRVSGKPLKKTAAADAPSPKNT